MVDTLPQLQSINRANHSLPQPFPPVMQSISFAYFPARTVPSEMSGLNRERTALPIERAVDDHSTSPEWEY
jgi:hypothetical protein